MLPQRHVKDPGHSAKSAGGRLQLSTHTALTQQSRSGLTTLLRHDVETCQGNELLRNSSWNARPQSFQLSELLWTDPLRPGKEELMRGGCFLFKEEEEKKSAGAE